MVNRNNKKSHTGVNGLVAGQVAFVAEGRLAVVTLVWLVAVHLGHVVFQGVFLNELGVAPIAEVGVVICRKQRNKNIIFKIVLDTSLLKINRSL